MRQTAVNSWQVEEDCGLVSWIEESTTLVSDDDSTHDRQANARSNGGVILPATFSENVNKLVAAEFEDAGNVIAAIHDQIDAGVWQVVYELTTLVFGITSPDEIDARCLALEALATAPLPNREPLLNMLIRFCLLSDDEALQFRAIGAANTLPSAMRKDLVQAVRAAADSAEESSPVKRLGALFLKNNS